MKLPRQLLCFGLFLASTFLVPLFAADSGPFRYNLAEGTTNGYRITFEFLSETNPRKYEGVIAVSTSAVTRDGATVKFRAHLLPDFSRRGRMMGPGPDRFQMIPLTVMAEAVVDERGRILRNSGIPDLPKILENYATLAFEAFPEEATAEWRESIQTTAEEERTYYGPGGEPHPYLRGGAPRSISALLSGVRTTTCQIVESLPASVRLKKQTEFRSWMTSGDQPRLLLTSTSDIVFDPQIRALRSVNLEATSTTANPDLLERTRIRVTLDYLEPELLAKALPRPAGSEPTHILESELPRILADLRGNDEPRKENAIMRLLNSNLEEHAAALLPEILPFATHENVMLRNLVASVLAKGATPEEVPLLLNMLQAEEPSPKHHVIEALQRVQDERAIEPLAKTIAAGSGPAFRAAAALSEFGPAAEPATLRLLQEKHLETVRYACDILKKIGTQQSLEPLQNLIVHGDPSLVQNLTEAIRAIRLRSVQNK